MSVEPPRASRAESLSVVVEAGVAAIPLVGGPAAILINSIVGTRYRRRLHDFLIEMGEAIDALSSQIDGLSATGLAENEVFLDALSRAMAQVGGESSRIRLDALRNTVLNNVLIGNDASGLVRADYFWSLVERFRESHLVVLSFYADPLTFVEDRGLEWSLEPGNGYPTIGALFQLVSEDGVRSMDRVWAQVVEEGLVKDQDRISPENIHDALSPSGREFWNFISDPTTVPG